MGGAKAHRSVKVILLFTIKIQQTSFGLNKPSNICPDSDLEYQFTLRNTLTPQKFQPEPKRTISPIRREDKRYMANRAGDPQIYCPTIISPFRPAISNPSETPLYFHSILTWHLPDQIWLHFTSTLILYTLPQLYLSLPPSPLYHSQRKLCALIYSFDNYKRTFYML